jgi:hypothetical protein
MAAGKAVLKLQLSNQLQEPKKSCAFVRCQFFSQSIVGGHSRIDEAFPVFVAFWRQLNVNCSARFGFPLRHKPFLNHRPDGSVHNSSIETEKCGGLIPAHPL